MQPGQQTLLHTAVGQSLACGVDRLNASEAHARIAVPQRVEHKQQRCVALRRPHQPHGGERPLRLRRSGVYERKAGQTRLLGRIRHQAFERHRGDHRIAVLHRHTAQRETPRAAQELQQLALRLTPADFLPHQCLACLTQLGLDVGRRRPPQRVVRHGQVLRLGGDRSKIAELLPGRLRHPAHAAKRVGRRQGGVSRWLCRLGRSLRRRGRQHGNGAQHKTRNKTGGHGGNPLGVRLPDTQGAAERNWRVQQLLLASGHRDEPRPPRPNMQLCQLRGPTCKHKDTTATAQTQSSPWRLRGQR